VDSISRSSRCKLPFIASVFSNNLRHQLRANHNPDLRLDGVLRIAKEMLDCEVLFEPFEEEFNLPAHLVNLRNCERWQVAAIC